MSRNLIIIGGLVLLTLLGIGAYLTVGNRGASPESSVNQQTSTETNTSTQAQSLEDFLTMTDDQQCTFTDATSETSGTIYVSNQQLRGDFVTNSDGMEVSDEVSAHVIANSQDVYLWMDGVEEGYKTSLSSISEASADLPISDFINPDENVDYQCTPWTADTSKFELPDMEFNDLSALLNNSEGNSLQCAACDTLSGEAQTQCRAALSCN